MGSEPSTPLKRRASWLDASVVLGLFFFAAVVLGVFLDLGVRPPAHK